MLTLELPLGHLGSIRIIPQGTAITALAHIQHWTYVSVGNETGWLFSDSLEIPTSVPANTSPRITIRNANFRIGPGPAQDIIRLLPLGTRVTVLTQTEHWSYVSVRK